MSSIEQLDNQVRQAGYYAALGCLLVTIPSLFLPLDAPAGMAAEQADRIAWLVENRSVFVTAWVVQILAMASLTAVLLAFTWQLALARPLRGLLAALFALVSFVAFIIPKFIAVWTIPQLAQALASGGIGSELAQPLLLILNVSAPFSLFTSFDYLGFWLYAVVSLLIAGPLLAGGRISKACGLALGGYGILYHGVVGGVLAGVIGPEAVESCAMGAAALLMIAVVVAVFHFRASPESVGEALPGEHAPGRG